MALRLSKEALAEIFNRRQFGVARERFVAWCDWAARSRLTPLKKRAGTIRRHVDGVLAFIATGLSNGPPRVNGKNTRRAVRLTAEHVGIDEKTTDTSRRVNIAPASNSRRRGSRSGESRST
jgi:hypothetical protein